MLDTNISVLITSKCTLNCEYCSVGVPYHTAGKHIPMSEVLEQVQEILALYTAAEIPIKHLDLLGGEPLLHPELTELIKAIYPYRAIFHELRILTNGTILPSEELLQTLKSLKNEMAFQMIVADYGKFSPKNAEICRLLEQYGILYRVDCYNGDNQYWDGWVSYGQDGILQDTAAQRFRECAFYHSGTAEVFDGLLFPCVRALALHTTNRIMLPETEYINLQEKRSVNRLKLLSYFTQEQPYSVCAGCSGLCARARRYPAAKQLTREERT
ncbi:MAG: radical SAM protein [Anaerotruncus sp.]|nr:radical SAM protein [Anaerotruncus sp.]